MGDLRIRQGVVAGLIALLVPLCPGWSQPAPGTVRGQVTDPSGASVPAAEVRLSRENGVSRTANTDVRGVYQFSDVPPDAYTIRVIANGFTPSERTNVTVGPGAQTLNFSLEVLAEKQSVTVQDTARVDVDPSSNADALVLSGKELDALSDDRDDLAADLAALAGPGAGPSGG